MKETETKGQGAADRDNKTCAARKEQDQSGTPFTPGWRQDPSEKPSHLKMPPLPSNKFSRNSYWPQRKFQNSIKKPRLGSRFSAPPQII